ncbi:MAG: hypothetical protein MUF10_01725 [Thermoanaerobaculaceae bacterium]|nr:hypothetical protein [Thermoanaerobaculaceae bacterium]
MAERPAGTWPFPSPSRCAVIAHGEIHPTSRADDLDTLEEIETVATALRELGWDPRPVPFTLDVSAFIATVRALNPAFVFNLVESVDGSGRLLHLATSVCEHLGLPYTGAPTAAMLLTTSKLEAKRVLRLAGLPTAGWVEPAQLARGRIPLAGPWILKPVWEDASVGIDHDGVTSDPEQLVVLWRERTRALGTEFFAERFIDGRELNLAVVAGPRGPWALPPAEIEFGEWDPGAPRIVGWRAKWDCEAVEYERTTRVFRRDPRDVPLHRRLTALARRCWRLFGLRGYARVDVRVDRRGRPFILEINANPCISPDAGFLAATREVGLGTTEVVARIIRDCNLPAVATAAVPLAGS